VNADAARAVVGFALAESLRRRVFAIVIALTVVFLALYGLGAHFAFEQTDQLGAFSAGRVDERTVTGSTVLGLAMFGTLFLGAVLAVFLTIGVVRGDAETGLLQPLVVRPLGRGTMLGSRFAGAAAAAAIYVLAVYGIAVLLTWVLGDWSPDNVIAPGLALALAVVILAALSVLISVFVTSTAQGIAVFMIFGAGLVAGLLGQIGEALGSHTLQRIAEVASYAVPFEALYQQGLYLLTSAHAGLTGAVVQLGPFGGAHHAGGWLLAYSIAYAAAAVALAIAGFSRRDL
jgi:ABC-type transport system involved in multi-copper enzyme maturation permease subunit